MVSRPIRTLVRTLPLLVAALWLTATAFAQGGIDQIRTGTGLGVEKVRLAVPDFKQMNADPQTGRLLGVFNQTLWNDLNNAGIFEMVAKSFYPLQQPGDPSDLACPATGPCPKLEAWSNPPPNTGMLAFGNVNASGADLVVQGWLVDAKNPGPPVLAKQYREQPTDANARKVAHEFADEIIFRLGGGIPGIAESKLVYVHGDGHGHKEVWEMDYDGNNQHQVTHTGSLALSPRISPDGTRVAFSEMTSTGWQIRMYSLDLNRQVYFPTFKGTNLSPAWSPDGSKLAFSSSMPGDPEIYVCDNDGRNLHRVTAYHGPDVSPVWNAKTGGQIAWVTGRSGLPQIYLMGSDGTNPEPVTGEGYAVSPSWSPNGQYLAFAWIRHYGPGAPGAQDIYLMDIASHQFVQLTHDAGRNDFPSWSPDGRHIVFQSSRSGSDQIWTMLADGTQQQQLTTSGSNTQPNWSWK